MTCIAPNFHSEIISFDLMPKGFLQLIEYFFNLPSSSPVLDLTLKSACFPFRCYSTSKSSIASAQAQVLPVQKNPSALNCQPLASKGNLLSKPQYRAEIVCSVSNVNHTIELWSMAFQKASSSSPNPDFINKIKFLVMFCLTFTHVRATPHFALVLSSVGIDTSAQIQES